MRLLPLLCVALLAAGCYDSRFGERGDDATPEPVTATIRQLREKFAGTTFPVTGDIVVSGRVTTSDYDENFYRTFCIEEDGAGIEVMAGIDHLHNDFPEGCQVTLRLRGLALGESHGVLQAGRMPAAGSGFATDYIGSKAALDAAVTRNGEALEPIAPTLLSPGELTPERCGTLVRIGALSYTPEDLTPGTWAGYKRFTDDTGAAVTIHCNGLFLCDYGGKVMLGTRPTDEYAGPGRIPQAEAALYLRRKQAETRPLRPRTFTFGEVDMRHTDTYVHFEGVRFVQQGNWCDPDPETGRPATTERRIADHTGREFIVRTAGTCTYATEPVPQGTGSVYGIIDYFNGKYTLRIANREVDFATVAARPTACPSSGGYSAPKPTR